MPTRVQAVRLLVALSDRANASGMLPAGYCADLRFLAEHNSLAALALLLLLSSLFPLLWSLVARVLLLAAIACVAVTRRPQQRSE